VKVKCENETGLVFFWQFFTVDLSSAALMERYLRDLLYGLPYKSAHLQKLQKYVPTRFLVLFLFFTSETGGNFLKHESFLL